MKKVATRTFCTIALIGTTAGLAYSTEYTEEYTANAPGSTQKVERGQTYNFGFDLWVLNNDPNTTTNSSLVLNRDANSIDYGDALWTSATLYIDFYDGDNDSDTAKVVLTPWINSNTSEFGAPILLDPVLFPNGTAGEEHYDYQFSHVFTQTELSAFSLGWGNVAISTYGDEALNDFSIRRVSLVVNAEPANQNPVPEPATMLLFGSGLAGLAAARRKQKAK